MNNKVLFNDGWEFAKSNLDTKDYKDLKFNKVDIPHDYLIYNSLDLYEDSIGWYKKEFVLTSKEEDKKVLLCFDGVYMDSTLYVNNELVGQWKYGYSSFEHDISKAINIGKNEIILKVVFKNPNSRWYSGAGIYRDVYLKTRNKNHIMTNGIYVSTKQNKSSWCVTIDTSLKLYKNAKIKHQIVKDNEVIGESLRYIKNIDNKTINDEQIIEVYNPNLWSTDEPNLYKLKTELYIDNNGKEKIIELVTQNIGFRNITFDHDRGLFLNGKHIKLQGVCEHHDFGALGSAFNKAALKRRFLLLREMGVNAIRTSHNMPDRSLMDLADEMGFLILSESFDMWERPKTKYDYARFFKDYALIDIKNWVMRDRNHPSLFMWSIGNEIYDTHADKRGQEITRALMDCVHKYDYRENGKVTIASNYMQWENAQKCADIVKIAGYNYGEKCYKEHHEKYKDWIIYGSETGSVVQSRGVYHFPLSKSILADDDEQCSSLGNSSTSWGAKSTEACIITDRDTEFSLGQFIWTGFDYIGEPTPYHTKNSYFGQLDTATFKKDSFYIYQAEWTDYKKSPMIHIFPYWDFNKGENIDVRVCSNAPKIELQFNGRIIGSEDIDHKHGKELVKTWTIPYEKGVLKAIAYDEKNNVIAVDIKKSFKDAKEIYLKCDKDEINANGLDLAFIEINMKDEDGNIVENANNRVTVSVSGNGRLVGLDNGDSTDYDQYKGISRRLFSGKLMAIVGSTLEEGDIEVKVTSKGLESETLILKSIKPRKDATYIPKFMQNEKREIVTGTIDEIPLRKIEIESTDGQLFNKDKNEITIKMHLYPENTSYKEVEWSVVNECGIKSNLANVKSNKDIAKVTALGDGDFKVRCTSKNGTDKIKIISEIQFKAEGLGTAFKNPYEFISAGLYDKSSGEVTNGNEKGIATMVSGRTIVGFENVDFGRVGSNIITIPIFTLNNEEYKLEIWEGAPYKSESTLLYDGVYQKESIWNVYQEETYVLEKRLKNITSIYFVAYAKMHIKGFIFKKINRAFQKNLAIECDKIYGDSFKIQDNKVQKIGNNVSIVFENMDFTEEGSSKIRIYGYSPIDKNTINIQFESEDGTIIRQLIEFSYSTQYEERVFNIEKIRGKQKVTLIFLPGSNFNLEWLCFEK